jgi:folate-binding protein YgfZ
MGSSLSFMKIPAEAIAFPYSPACVLRVGGADAATFLQGQFTNDLSRMRPGGSVYGLWLDRKGRVIGDSRVVLGPDASGYWIVSTASPGAVIAKHLGDHIIADDVEVSDETAGWRAVAVIGAGTGAWLSSEPRAGMVFKGRRAASENWEWIHPSSESAGALGALSGARVADALDMERLRIQAAIPSVPGDIGPADLPNEGGLDVDAISYSKGCYLGQEVMARIKALGRVRRALVRVAGPGAPPPLPSGLWQGERREGDLRSAVPAACGFEGLALVSVTSIAGGGSFALAPGSSPTVAVVRP